MACGGNGYAVNLWVTAMSYDLDFRSVGATWLVIELWEAKVLLSVPSHCLCKRSFYYLDTPDQI